MDTWQVIALSCLKWREIERGGKWVWDKKSVEQSSEDCPHCCVEMVFTHKPSALICQCGSLTSVPTVASREDSLSSASGAITDSELCFTPSVFKFCCLALVSCSFLSPVSSSLSFASTPPHDPRLAPSCSLLSNIFFPASPTLFDGEGVNFQAAEAGCTDIKVLCSNCLYVPFLCKSWCTLGEEAHWAQMHGEVLGVSCMANDYQWLATHTRPCLAIVLTL